MQPSPPSAPALAEFIARILGTLYDAHLRGDTAAIDELLHRDCSVFDSARPTLVSGSAQLAELRRQRGAATAPRFRDVSATIGELNVRDIAGVVLATYRLTIGRQTTDGTPVSDEIDRVTAVFAPTHNGLRIIHLHEDVLQAEPAARPPKGTP